MDDRATVKRGKDADVFEVWQGVGTTSDDEWLGSMSCPAFDQGSAPSIKDETESETGFPSQARRRRDRDRSSRDEYHHVWQPTSAQTSVAGEL